MTCRCLLDSVVLLSQRAQTVKRTVYPDIKKSPFYHTSHAVATAAIGAIVSRDLACFRPPGRAEVTSSTTTTPLSSTSGTKVGRSGGDDPR